MSRLVALYENQNSKPFLQKYSSRTRNILEGIIPTQISYIRTVVDNNELMFLGEDFRDTMENIELYSIYEFMNLFDTELTDCILNEELTERDVVTYFNEKMSRKKKAAIAGAGLAGVGAGGAGAAYMKGSEALKGTDASAGDKFAVGKSILKAKGGEIKQKGMEYVEKGREGLRAAGEMVKDTSVGQKAALGVAAAGAAGLAGYKAAKAIKNRMKKKKEEQKG